MSGVVCHGQHSLRRPCCRILRPCCRILRLLQLQKYTLDVKYKKGEHMYLADTLSRAYIPEVNVCDFVHELEELDHRVAIVPG